MKLSDGVDSALLKLEFEIPEFRQRVTTAIGYQTLPLAKTGDELLDFTDAPGQGASLRAAHTFLS
jgi:hypothetical protein